MNTVQLKCAKNKMNSKETYDNYGINIKEDDFIEQFLDNRRIRLYIILQGENEYNK